MKRLFKVVLTVTLLAVVGLATYDLYLPDSYRWADTLVVLFDCVFINNIHKAFKNVS